MTSPFISGCLLSSKNESGWEISHKILDSQYLGITVFDAFPQCLSLCQDTLADEENICFGGRHEVGKESDDNEDQKVDE